MMAGCSSWCKETDEKINYTKLCRLLVDGGTQAVRSVFDGIHPPSSLAAILNTNKTTLQKLKKPKGKVLNYEQWDKLYPPSGSKPKSEDFDITLLFVLLRNICGLTPPVCDISSTGKRKRSWNELPHKTDTSPESNLARIKYYRNNAIAHRSKTEINDVDFEQYWQDISSALLSLGLSQEDIDDLKLARLGEKDYNQLLYDWYISDEDIKTQLNDLKMDTSDIMSDTTVIKSDITVIKSDTTVIKSDTTVIKSDTTVIKSDMTDIKSDTTDIKEKVNDLHSKYVQAYRQNNSIDQLSNDEFSGFIDSLCKSFHPNTRQWILDQVKSYVDSDQPESCIMMITAGPGMGKSTVAAKICEMYKDLGCLGGCHFFQFSNSTRNNPRLMLQSIARQMCDTVPGYEMALEKKLQTDLGKKIPEMKCEELFTVLFEEPLHKLETVDSARNKIVIVLDAIDECSSDLKHDLLQILKNKLSMLPSWLRFVITTRPSPSPSAIQSRNNIFIDPKCQQNKLDLENFYTANFEVFCKDTNDHSPVIDRLIEMSNGLFLVAFFLIDFVQKQKITSPSDVFGLFPNGISSVYEKYFERVKTELLPYISEEERFYKMLEAIVASKDPLPISMVYNILGLHNERDVPRSDRKKRRDALNLLHSLFPVENDQVTAFHKTLVDWLIIEGDEEHDFSVCFRKESKTNFEKLSNESGSVQGINAAHDPIISVEREDVQVYNKPMEPTDRRKYANKKHDFSVCVEDGKEVLSEECYDVLSDLINGKKDLDKPFDLTDGEKYALMHRWDVSKGTGSTTEEKKGNYGMLINYLTFTAGIYSLNRQEWQSCTDDISNKFKEIGSEGFKYFGIGWRDHDMECCPFLHKSNFGRCVEFVLNAAYDMKVSEDEMSPNPLQLLKKYELAYFEKKSIAVKLEEGQSMSSDFHIVACENGYILAEDSKQNTVVYKYNLDGTCLGKKSFPGLRKICMSPDHRFIVVIKVMEKGDIEILDARTLELVTSYQSPNVIKSCHVFGDEPWYIVARCFNNKIYVLEGESGRLDSSPARVDQYVDVEAVGASGCILLKTTWESTDHRIANAWFTDEDGNFLEEMNWHHKIYALNFPRSSFMRKKSVKENDDILYRRLFLCHFTKMEEKVSIYPRRLKCCRCQGRSISYERGWAIGFSKDGSLLAYRYKSWIFIIHTSNASLYKIVFLGPCSEDSYNDDVLFLSDTYIVYKGLSIMLINLKTKKIEHRFLIPQNQIKKFYVVPRKQEEPFTLITYLNDPNNRFVLKYEFYNIDL